jgi:hypothetical protein
MREKFEHLLEKISDEVNEFHPLLHSVLDKLPNVRKVDYTHGNAEMGADFILSKWDDISDYEDYVGVVAKIGSIKQDHDDVLRQIDECLDSGERFFADGRKIVSLSEVWVICNGNITQNAQKKINHKFRNSKIRFYSGGWLVEKMLKYLPDYGVDVAPKINSYLSIMSEKAVERDSQNNLMPDYAKDLYVEQYLKQIDNSTYSYSKKASKTEKKRIFEILGIWNFILVEGEMGAGKSKLINKVLEHYSTVDIYSKDKFVPVFISFSNFFSDHKGSLVELLKNISAHNGLENEGKFVILIDSMDELDVSEEKRGELLISISKELNDIIVTKEIKVIVTCRCIESENLILTLKNKVARFRLLDLDLGGIGKFVEAVAQKLKIATRTMEDLRKSSLYKVLPRTPIAAILLAKLMNERQELPSNLTELYLKYVEQSLGRWDINKGLRSMKEFDTAMSVTSNIAKYLLDNQLPGLTYDETKTFFDDYLQKRNLGIDSELLLKKILERSEIFSIDGYSRLIRFRHRTFTEFFYALNVSKNGEFEIDERAFSIYWNTTLFFLLGLKRDCPVEIRALSELKPKNEFERLMKIIFFGQWLLAAYATPYDAIDLSLKTVFEDAIEYLMDIRSGKILSPFSQMSEMHLLNLFRNILYDSYSYEFFSKSFTNAINSILSTDQKDERAALLLFYLCLACKETGGIDLLSDVVKEFGPNLPIPIKMAVVHESDLEKTKPDVIKRMEKNFKKTLVGNAKMHAYLDKIYNKSLRPKLGK